MTAAEQSPTSSRTCPTSKSSASRVCTAWNRHSSPCVGFPYDVQQYVFVAVVHCTCHMLRSMKKERESPYRCFHGMTEHHRLHSNYHRPLMPSSILICLQCPGFFFLVAKERLAHASMVDSMPRSRIAGAHMMSCDSSCEDVFFFLSLGQGCGSCSFDFGSVS